MSEAERVGEVIEAHTADFTAQCYELYQSPPLGSLVRVGGGGTEIYGVVCQVTTSSFEPGRRPIARGKDEASVEAVYQANPQLVKLLRSEFEVLVAGHKDGDRLHHYLPPHPARIHDFVYQCAPEEVAAFSASFGFLNILVHTALPVATDEIIGAVLRRMSRVHDDPRAFLVAAGKELALLLSSDFGRLKAVLGRLKE